MRLSGISIIIPAHNEEKYIYSTLDHIKTETINAKLPYEIIVVDNLSQDTTPQILRDLIGHYEVCEIKGNPAATRNKGAAVAKYDIFCFIDGDCLVTEHWLQRIIEAFSDEKVGAFGGPALSPKSGNWVETAWAPTAIKPFIRRRSALPGANFCVRKDIFMSLGGFDETLMTAEDDDFSRRIIEVGYDVVADSRHPVIHLGYPKTLMDIYRKQVWHGSSQLKAHGILGDRMVIATLVWATSIVTFPFLAVINSQLSLINIALFFLIPLLIAKKRTEKFYAPAIKSTIKAYPIAIFFLVGRSIGLLKEFLNGRYAKN